MISIALLALLPTVLAHGFVSTMSIAGKPYPGNRPNAFTAASAIRQIDDTGPVKGVDNADINCGHAATLASVVASAQPGDKVDFKWDAGDGANWPHDTGPMITYMANCGSQTCDKFNSANAKWFKIDQVGQVKPGGNWKQLDIKNGQSYTLTLPPTLAAGNYLIRHEIIALHLGMTSGGAEFYPSCSQIRVGGTQTGAPSPDELVSFPGAYGTNDPGIFVPHIYDGIDYSTLFPGPKLSKLAAQSDDTVATPGTPASSSSKPSATKPASPAGSALAPKPTKKTCKLKKKTATLSANLKRSQIKRHVQSRITGKLFR